MTHTVNLEAIADLESKLPGLELIFVESGGDNLAATFSPELSDLTLYVIDVAGGDKIPRKRGPGLILCDLLVINKTDLAPHVGVDADLMQREGRDAAPEEQRSHPVNQRLFGFQRPSRSDPRDRGALDDRGPPREPEGDHDDDREVLHRPLPRLQSRLPSHGATLGGHRVTALRAGVPIALRKCANSRDDFSGGVSSDMNDPRSARCP